VRTTPPPFHLDRTPEACVADLLNAGVTSFAGVLGRNTASRSPRSVLAKVRALHKAGGLSGFVVSGAADGSCPPPSCVSSSCGGGGGGGLDLALIDEVVGLGTFAVSDPHHPHPTAPSDLARSAGECFSSGALAGKPGLLYCRLGSGAAGFAPLRALFHSSFHGR